MSISKGKPFDLSISLSVNDFDQNSNKLLILNEIKVTVCTLSITVIVVGNRIVDLSSSLG